MSTNPLPELYREAAQAHQAERDLRQAEALTLEFRQPLIQQFRRRRPRRRSGAAPLFDPQQLHFPTGDPTE